MLNKWEDGLLDYTQEDNKMRPRSVCISSILSLSTTGKNVAVLFGGEVDPSDRGHEGAGGGGGGTDTRGSWLSQKYRAKIK